MNDGEEPPPRSAHTAQPTMIRTTVRDRSGGHAENCREDEKPPVLVAQHDLKRTKKNPPARRGGALPFMRRVSSKAELKSETNQFCTHPVFQRRKATPRPPPPKRPLERFYTVSYPLPFYPTPEPATPVAVGLHTMLLCLGHFVPWLVELIANEQHNNIHRRLLQFINKIKNSNTCG